MTLNRAKSPHVSKYPPPQGKKLDEVANAQTLVCSMQTIENKKLITQITKDCICPYTLKFIGIDVSKNKLDVYETKNNR
ncbi:hypothetical protein AGMMS50222_07410 [Endomicrobiia bacterium]|nr:hypothetical protein AGMMS49556_07200 [Endomicrobiia bacterium]GHT75789.1 hypothetical protein AGMMS50222_07410 [Endomicrobiia bacterium]